MEFTTRHREAETGFRRLLQDGGVAQPDAVEISSEGLVFLWHEQKLAVVVELDGPT